MIQMYPKFASDSSTYYVREDIPAGQEAVVAVPAAVGAVSFDIYGNDAPVEFSIYVTNASMLDVEADVVTPTNKVVWHPTKYLNIKSDFFKVVTAMAGAYKVICTTGNISVTVRAK